jgi:hypothetical protein
MQRHRNTRAQPETVRPISTGVFRMTWKINVALLIAVLELTLWTFSAKRSASIRGVLLLKSALMTSAIRGATQDTTRK